MGIFSKKPKVDKCGMCDAVVPADERFSHQRSHIVMIGATEPSWLPERLRAVAQGQYTFRCDRCNSYPDIKWPSEGGAEAGMEIHLAGRHGVGNSALGGAVKFGMTPIG